MVERQTTTRGEDRLRIAVIVATTGRAALLPVLLDHLDGQTRRADVVVLSGATQTDIDATLRDRALVIFGRRGSSCQRNRALDLVEARSDIVVFFDDDFIMARDWLEQAERVFRAHPEVGCVTGEVLADGANGPGISVADAQRIVAEDEVRPRTYAMRPFGAPYGCNMAFRTSALAGVRFDERLALYGWQEDLDFGARMNAGALTMKVSSLRGVHMGIKSGRTSGVRFGASQIINNAYLWRKGTMPLGRAVKFAGRNLAANLRGSLQKDPLVDRRGRLKGNLIGLWEVARGRLDPEIVERL